MTLIVLGLKRKCWCFSVFSSFDVFSVYNVQTVFIPDICHFLTPAPFLAEEFYTNKLVNRNTTDFATKQRKSFFYCLKQGDTAQIQENNGRGQSGGRW